MITFGPATYKQIHYVSMMMRDRDFEEITAVNYENTREELADALAKRYDDFPFCFCFSCDNEPVCILVGVNCYPGFWSIGMWATPKISKIGKKLTSIIRNEFFGAMRASGMHRVECKSIVGYNEVHKWLLALGFRIQEKGILEKFGKDKQDFILFEWVEGMPWPKGYKGHSADEQGRVLY